MRMVVSFSRIALLLLMLVVPLYAMGQQGFINGKKEFNNGNYAKAIKLFESAKIAGASDKGLCEIEKYIERAKRCKDLRIKADNAYNNGDYNTAKKYYGELMKAENNPNDPEARKRMDTKMGTAQQTSSQPKQQASSQPRQQTPSQPRQQTTSQPRQQTTSHPKQQTTSHPRQQTFTKPKLQQPETTTGVHNQQDNTGEGKVERNARLAVESFQKAYQYYSEGNYSLALSQLSECRKLGLWGDDQQELHRNVCMSRDYALVLESTSQLTIIPGENAAQVCRDFVENYHTGPNVPIIKRLLCNYYISKKDYNNARKYANEIQLRYINNLNRPNTIAPKHRSEPIVKFGVFGNAMLPILPECGLTLRFGSMDDYFNFTLNVSHQWMQTDTAQGWNHWVMVENSEMEDIAWYGECNMIRYRQWNIQTDLRINFVNNDRISPYMELGGIISFNVGSKVLVPSWLSDEDLIALTDIKPMKLIGGSAQITTGVSWKRIDVYLFARYTAIQSYDKDALDKLYLFNISPMIGESVTYEVDCHSAAQILQMAESRFPYSYYRVQNLLKSSSTFAEALEKRLYWGVGARFYLY